MVGARRQVRLSCTPRKDEHGHLRKETQTVLLKIVGVQFLRFSKEMKFILG
jgi:hypothetical protein